MLSLYFESFISFVWLCCYFGLVFIETYLAYAIAWEALLVIQQQKSFPNWHEISFLLESTLPNMQKCVEALHDIYWFSPLQKPAKIYIICILNFNVSLCWLVGGKSPVFSRFSIYSTFVLKFLIFTFC